MRVAVAGSRDCDDPDFVYDGLWIAHRENEITSLLHGGAKGVDKYAAWWARENGVREWSFEARWDEHGDAAGPIRNREMIRSGDPEILIAFPGGDGTDSCRREARLAGVPIMEITRDAATGEVQARMVEGQGSLF